MSYQPVTITDSTNYVCWGTVSYLSAFCPNDDYYLTPNTTWTASSRGTCLVIGISATVRTPNGDIVATPYAGGGAPYSSFAIIQTGPNSFAITRIVNSMEDEKPANYVEPKEKQK